MARSKGERYRCEKCSAELMYTKPCPCKEGRHEEICCGQQMKRVEEASKDS